MTVPKMSQLRPGVGVNMVLKADQRSSRLTSGSISEVHFACSGPLFDFKDMSSNALWDCPVAQFLAFNI